MTRTCDGCTLCCRLLPVPPLGKKDNQRCRHEVAGGCGIYRRPDLLPRVCKAWHCRWLLEADTADQLRPDVSHLVIDEVPDFIAVVDNETGNTGLLEVVQVWCDPAHRDAHRDPTFRRYAERRAEQGAAILVRFSSSDAITLFAPALTHDRQWHERDSSLESEQEHRARLQII